MSCTRRKVGEVTSAAMPAAGRNEIGDGDVLDPHFAAADAQRERTVEGIGRLRIDRGRAERRLLAAASRPRRRCGHVTAHLDVHVGPSVQVRG